MTRDDIEDIHYLVNAALCRKAHEAKIARLDTDADARKIPAVLNGFDVVEDRIGAPHGGGKGGGLSYWKRDADGTLLRVVMERATMDGTEVLMFRTMEKVKD